MLWLALLGLVAALGGLIAYAGDVVGRKIGRKHLRLFGLRPKTSGLIVAVLSGVAVALLSVGAVGVLARDTLNTAIRAQEIRRELESARADLSELRADSDQQRRELSNVKASRLKLEADLVSSNDELTASRAQLSANQQELGATAALNGKLRVQLQDLKGARAKLEAERATLVEERARLAQQIADKSAALDRATLDSARRVAALDRELRALDAQRARLSGDLERLRTGRTKLEARIAELALEKDQALASARTATAQLAPARRKLQDLSAQLEGLDAALADMRAERTQLEAARRAAENAKASLEGAKARLEEAKAGLEKEVSGLYQLRANLQQDIARLETENARLAALVAQRTNENQALNTDLRDARTQLLSASRGEFIYRKGELIAQAVLPDGEEPAVRSRLDGVLRQAAILAEQRGAQRGKGVQLEPNAAELDRLVRDAARTSGPDLVLVRSSQNLARGRPAQVRVEQLPNAVMYPALQPIRTRQVALGTASNPRPDAEVRAEVDAMLREVLEDLRGRRMPLENIPSEAVAESDIAEFVGRLRQLRGTVWIAVASRQDLTPAGPLRLYLFILG